MYFNLKHGTNTNLKGEIGEVIAKHHLKDAISTREYWHTIVDKQKISLNQKEFLKDNWKSFDLINLKSLEIFEVKTRKFFNKKLKGIKNKIVITPNFSKLCNKSKDLGFVIRIIEITLFDDWKYGVNIKDFDNNDFCVHKPRLSGWEG